MRLPALGLVNAVSLYVEHDSPFTSIRLTVAAPAT